jgi:hypothetical protein
MHSIDIYRAGNFFTTIKPDDSSTQVKKVMGDNQLSITFEDNRHINFKINDYCTVFGEVYKLSKLPPETKGNKYSYKYTLVMNSVAYDLSKIQLLFLDVANNLTEADFSLMGNPDTFIDLIISNANRAGSGWTKGQVVLGNYKNLTFTKENCYNVLSRLAEEFETEFSIEGQVISLTKRVNDTGYTFKHGRNKGLYEIARQNRDNSDIVTRLYAYGSEKNLPEEYLISGRRLRLPDGVYPFIEKNVDKYGLVEATEIFEDIYPRRTGKVTAVNAGDPFVFTDVTMDFDVNDQLLPGLSAKVVFNTGQLAGYQFEVKSYNNSTKQFTILKNSEERVLDIPNNTFRPAISDQYVLVDIRMPDAYITAAEEELKIAAQALLDQASEPQLSYSITIDPLFLKRRNRTINIYDLVWIIDDELEIQRKIRVIATTRNIVNEYNYQVELSDIVSPGTIERIFSSQASTDRDVRDLNGQVINNSIFNNNVIGTLSFSDMPETSTDVGFLPVYIEISTGKLYKKV